MFAYHFIYVVMPTKYTPENVHFIPSLLVIPLKNRDQYLLTYRGPHKCLNIGFYIMLKIILRLQKKSTMDVREKDAGELLSYAYFRTHLFYDFLSTSDYMMLKDRLICERRTRPITLERKYAKI